ncbi:hypothetical protein Tco_0818184 [Tanacetum coccineum]
MGGARGRAYVIDDGIFFSVYGRSVPNLFRRRGVKLSGKIDIEFKIANDYSVRVNKGGGAEDGGEEDYWWAERGGAWKVGIRVGSGDRRFSNSTGKIARKRFSKWRLMVGRRLPDPAVAPERERDGVYVSFGLVNE